MEQRKATLKVGDTIKCHDKDDLIKTMTELSKCGIETDFLYEKDGEKGLWLSCYENSITDFIYPLAERREYRLSNMRQIKAIENQNKKRLLKVNPKLNERSGIYFLLREDENNFKYAYIGQARSVLQRLCSHMSGYKQHIDLSLRKHKLYDKDNNPYGWRVEFLNFPISELDEKEKYYIKLYADKGYQLRNVSVGGQGSERDSGQIGERKPAKGYYDGLLQGKRVLARQLSSIAEKHLKIEIREDKKNNKVSQKQFEKFKELMNEESYKESD